MEDCVWRTVYGGLCMEDLVYRGLCMEECVWRTVYGGMCMEDLVHGGLSMDDSVIGGKKFSLRKSQ